MKKYTIISLGEREIIYLLLQEGSNISYIANNLCRNKSSISREVKRCSNHSLGYILDRAHNLYRAGLSRNKALFLNEQLQDYVINKLVNNRWTPKEISASLKTSGLEKKASAETIYQFIYSKKGLKLNLPSYLKFRRKKRGFRKSRKRKKPHITNLVSIHASPEVINERSKIGYWEGDLIIFSTIESKNITTVVERKTRFVKLRLNQNKTSNEVVGGIKLSLEDELSMCKSMTFDRGSEFANHQELGIDTYFCDPGSP